MPKAEATELAPEAVGASPLVTITIRVVLPVVWRAFLYRTRSAFGGTSERRLWAMKREDRRAAFALQATVAFGLKSFIRSVRR